MRDEPAVTTRRHRPPSAGPAPDPRDRRDAPHAAAALALALGAALAACGDGGGAAPVDYRDPAAPIEARIDDLLPRLSLEEKVAQMTGTSLLPTDGIYLTPANERLGIPGFGMVDGPRGVRAGTATAFPVGMARGASFDPALEERVGEAIGEEVLARGGNVLLAPTINLLAHPRWGRAQETYGEDPHHLGAMGAAFVRGAQRHVVASPKHFAVNNIENTRFDVSANLDERTLREVFLPHFRAVVDAGAGSVMTAYNRVNGTYCSENAHLLHDILRGEWGFEGFVESDWVLAVRSTAPSVLAGLDVEMPQANFYGARLAEAVRAGEAPESAVDDSVRRILRAKMRFGIFDATRPAPDPGIVAGPDHVALARQAAREAIVLLRNRGGLLPLDAADLRRIAVVGDLAGRPNLGDFGSSYVSPPSVVTPLDGIARRVGDAALTHVASDAPSDAELAAIAAADVAVVVVGLTTADEGEGLITVGDRRSMGLSAAHVRLVQDVARVQPATVVVLEGGSAITTEGWGEAPAALLMAWYPGMEGGEALGEILFGEAGPSGRLPLSWPRTESQLQRFDNVSLAVAYDRFHGYRLLDRDGADPEYPFGFGLSYTSFRLANLALERAAIGADGTLRARVDVTNTGARAGTEVVQLYVAFPATPVERPVRELHAFARVDLAPGETRAVDLAVPAGELGRWDDEAGRWRVDTAEYLVEVGTSSRDLPLAAPFRVR